MNFLLAEKSVGFIMNINNNNPKYLAEIAKKIDLSGSSSCKISSKLQRLGIIKIKPAVSRPKILLTEKGKSLKCLLGKIRELVNNDS